ncbi:MAG: GntR family transcriptional regulator [Pseudomonadota bacterium]
MALRPTKDAYGAIIAAIRAGDLLPGSAVREVSLAKTLGVSRTPVREALRQLEAEGLVVKSPRVGTVIRTLTPTEVSELYDTRAVLEGSAARFAARAASPIARDELLAINADMAAAVDDPARLSALNTAFHAALLAAAHNRFLVAAVEGVRKTLLILGPTTLNRPRAADAVAEHAAVLSAIRARDEMAAEAAMRRHIEGAHAARLRQLRPRAEAA